MNEELRRLYEEERQDTRDYEGAESFLAAQARRSFLQRRLNERPDYLSEADDYYHATFLFQHGEELAHWWKAHELARKAVELGHPKARYLVAASLDRWLMRQDKPQKYGTNGIWDGELNRWRVWKYEPTTTDEERAEWEVPPLAELLSRLEYLNQDFNVPEKVRKAFALKTIAGYEILLTNLETDRSHYFSGGGVPPYLPLKDLEARLPGPLPPGLSFWKFDGVYCSKKADGEVYLTWHPCQWQPAGEDSEADKIYAKLKGQALLLAEEEKYWQRVLRIVSPTTAWLVGAALTRPHLQELALSLGDEVL